MQVIHKRLRATNLSVEEEVGEPCEGKIDGERKGQETQEGPHTLVSGKNNAGDQDLEIQVVLQARGRPTEAGLELNDESL